LVADKRNPGEKENRLAWWLWVASELDALGFDFTTI
jgi:hypothetical protein